jgi:hypothetical protein
MANTPGGEIGYFRDPDEYSSGFQQAEKVRCEEEFLRPGKRSAICFEI